MRCSAHATGSPYHIMPCRATVSGAEWEGVRRAAAGVHQGGPALLRHLPGHADALRGQRGVPGGRGASAPCGPCIDAADAYGVSREHTIPQGLGVIKGTIKRFDPSPKFSVPHIGWNGLLMQKHTKIIHAIQPEELVYFVHSYRAVPSPEAAPWALTLTTYGANFIRSETRRVCRSFLSFLRGRSNISVVETSHTRAHTHVPCRCPTTARCSRGG